MNAKYDFTPWLRASLRTGVDMYTEREIWRNSIGAYGGWDKKGYYEEQRKGGYSINNDIIISADKKFGDFSIDGFVGTTLYFYQDDVLNGKTSNGITIPGYYSLKASVDPAKVYSTIKKKQVNSLYGKASGSWKSTLFLDITARKQDRVISKNPDRLICIYIIIYQEVTFTTNRVSFYNLILYLLKNNVFSLSLYPFAFTPFTSLLPFFTILAFPSSYIQANDDAGH